MRITIDMPDLPDASADVMIDWVQELIDNSSIKKHVKKIYVEVKNENGNAGNTDIE